MQIFNIDGIDCSGKSTLCKELKETLIKQGKDTEVIHFPRYETEIGKQIKERLYSGNTKDIQELYLQDQIEFTSEIKQGKYDKYDCLILDRFFMSTLAYAEALHGEHNSITQDILKKQNKAFKNKKLLNECKNIVVAILTNADKDVVATRLIAKANRDCMENLDTIIKANNAYLKLAFNNPYIKLDDEYDVLPIITEDSINTAINIILGGF